jgi:Predicted transcriptional regulators
MNRLKDLRKENHMSQEELAKIFNVAQNTLSNWERGNREMDTKTVMEISKYFNVSTDYLLGTSNIRQEMTFDDFSYALYGEVRELNDEEKETLLNMAKFLRQQREKGKET